MQEEVIFLPNITGITYIIVLDKLTTDKKKILMPELSSTVELTEICKGVLEIAIKVNTGEAPM
jgi:hypothetical protein